MHQLVSDSYPLAFFILFGFIYWFYHGLVHCFYFDSSLFFCVFVHCSFSGFVHSFLFIMLLCCYQLCCHCCTLRFNFPCRSLMPPKKFGRACTPSTKANEVAAATEPPWKKSRQSAPSTPHTVRGQLPNPSDASTVGQAPV